MSWTPAAVVTLLSLSCAAAAACDLAAPVPGPGHLYLFRPDTGKEVDVPVQGRWLGAGCELSNAFAFDGKNLVWVEGPERSDAKQSLRIRGDDGATRVLSASEEARHELGLTSTHLYYIAGTFATPVLTKMRLTDGERTPTSAPIAYHAQLHGAHAAWFSTDGRRLNVHDAEAGTWLLRDQTLAALGVADDDQGQLLAFDDEFVFFASYRSTQTPTTFRYWTYEFATNELVAISSLTDPHAAWIDDGTLYLADFDAKHEGQRLQARPASGGAARDLGMLPHGLGERLVVEDGTVVLASYRHDASHTHTDGAEKGNGSSPVSGTEPSPIPSLSFLATILTALVLALRVPRTKP